MAPLHGNEDLLREVAHEVAEGRTEVALIGMTGIALSMWSAVSELGADVSIFDPEVEATRPCMRPWSELKERSPDLVVIASDERKERLLQAAADILDGHRPLPRVVLFGLAHQELPDPLFEELERPALVPSYATGHPYTRRHLYDCLRAAAANGREGAIVELGAFKGGTSVWLAKAARALGIAAKVIAFDAWDGFPERRSILDLYEHPRCDFRDLEAVRAYTEPYEIELVVGDIFVTAPRRLDGESILLAFIDTDNYSGTRAALDPIVANLVPGGAIVFDHFVTTSDYAYTVGERIAATEVLQGSGLLNLAGTGVFLKFV